jgi:hypothetical protein
MPRAGAVWLFHQTGNPRFKAEMLEILVALKAQAPEAFERYQLEVGLP